jgi:hypothetical protein
MFRLTVGHWVLSSERLAKMAPKSRFPSEPVLRGQESTQLQELGDVANGFLDGLAAAILTVLALVLAYWLLG